MIDFHARPLLTTDTVPVWDVCARAHAGTRALRSARRGDASGVPLSRRVRTTALSRKRVRAVFGRVGFGHGSALLSPTSLPAANHPARDLALSPVHPELPRRGGAAGRAGPGGFL